MDESMLEPMLGMLAFAFMLIPMVILIISMWKVFTKAGKPGWACIIPIYSAIVLLEIVGKPIWWIFLFMIPIVNIVVSIMVFHQLSLSFGKDVGFTVGLVLLSIIFIPILAFDSSVYIGPEGSRNGDIRVDDQILDI